MKLSVKKTIEVQGRRRRILREAICKFEPDIHRTSAEAVKEEISDLLECLSSTIEKDMSKATIKEISASKHHAGWGRRFLNRLLGPKKPSEKIKRGGCVPVPKPWPPEMPMEEKKNLKRLKLQGLQLA